MSLFGQSSHGLAMFPHALRWLLTYEAAAKSKATQQNIVESTPSAIQGSIAKCPVPSVDRGQKLLCKQSHARLCIRPTRAGPSRL